LEIEPMDDVWQWAIGAVALGIMSGLAAAGLLLMALTKGREEDPVYRDSARSMAISAFVFFTVVGVILAVSIVNRDSFEDVPGALVDVLPDLLIAGLILVVGRALALAAGSFVAKAIVASSRRVRDQVALLVRVAITAAAVVVALAQVGVDTTLLQITGGAVLFGLAAAAALLVGLGGRDMAAEIAAGRYLSRIVAVGDHIELDRDGGTLAGRVMGLHPATLEVLTEDGAVHHISNSQVLSAGVRRRPE
jgi:small-conductance mechanosensitive channel